MMRPKITTYGDWVLAKIDESQANKSDLQRATGIPYPSLMRMLSGNKKGNPVKIEFDNLQKINKGLAELGIVEDEREAWTRAGYVTDGYHVVKVGEVLPGRDPIETIIWESGHSEDVPKSEVAELREEVEDFIKTRIERRKKQGRSDTSKSQN